MSSVTILPRGLESKPAPQPTLRVEVVKPWLIDIWELLPTNAPNPCICRPFCCYICTVIFYLKPYQVTQRSKPIFNEDGSLWYVEKPGRVFEEWDRVDSAISWDQRIMFDGEEFECGGGTVIWHHRRWWMKHWARRRSSL